VVVDVLDGYAGFDKEDFKRHLPLFAPLVVGLLGRELSTEFQGALQRVVARIVEVSAGVDCSGVMMMVAVDGRGSSRRPSVKSPR
jgi:brefeldin A-inhibited guanine nucleotide-exchange protein